MGRVRIGTCSGPADAALVRAAFAAHEIHVVIGAEHHAGMLGGLGGSFVSLDIWVDEHDAEHAIALLRDVRGEGPDDAPAPSESRSAERASARRTVDHGVEEPLPADDDAEDDPAPVEQRIARRRGTGLVLLLGCCVTFGTGHIATGAWGRGIALAVLEVLGFRTMLGDPALGGAMVAAAIVLDLVGALVRVHKKRPELPEARLVR